MLAIFATTVRIVLIVIHAERSVTIVARARLLVVFGVLAMLFVRRNPLGAMCGISTPFDNPAVDKTQTGSHSALPIQTISGRIHSMKPWLGVTN